MGIAAEAAKIVEMAVLLAASQVQADAVNRVLALGSFYVVI